MADLGVGYPAIDDVAGLERLRRRVRADQRGASLPLIVLGAVTFHYATYRFVDPPLAWIYGAPLAFVVIWALQRRRESTVGVGAARDDTLVIAFVVWTTMQVPIVAAQSDLWWGGGAWTLSSSLAAVAGGLALLGWRSHQPLLVAWSVVYGTIGVIAGHDAAGTRGSYLALCGLGATTLAVGVVAYLTERATSR
jgi:hypothetical protein